MAGDPIASPRRLAVIRHGETDWNRRGLLQGRVDQPLNATGEARALLSAKELAGPTAPRAPFPEPAISRPPTPWARVIASPLRRASTTARIIAEHLGLDEPLIVPEFTEQSFGVAEGTPAKDAFLTWPSGDYPEGERRRDVDARVSTGLRRVLQVYPSEDLILVCHVVVARSIMNVLIGIEPDEVPNGSATVLVREPGTGRWSPRPPTRTTGPAQSTEGRT
ncbi:histidine phosphatase family protein [Plantibacter sp. YIM 135347]|uniref:histidine phosphatase family protein n=1 Tax=Plantibacter sp. YIM 135347 TaxID=3423919 RepID=UPI003D339813